MSESRMSRATWERLKVADFERLEAENERLRAAIRVFVRHHDSGQAGQPGFPRTYGEEDVWQAEWDRLYAALARTAPPTDDLEGRSCTPS